MMKPRQLKFAAAILGTIALTACNTHGETNASLSPYPKETARVTFVAAGDVIPHQAVVQSATAHKSADNHDGWDALFAGTADIFQSAD